MRTLSIHALMMSAALVTGAAISFACSTEDENPGTARQRTSSDSGADGASSGGSSSGTSGGTPGALCAKAGGVAGVNGIADSIITTAIGDCRVGIVVENARNQDDDQAHFDQCFQRFVAARAFQCPNVTFTPEQTKDDNDNVCNSQLERVTFTNTDFNAFVQDAQNALKARAFTDDEMRSIASAFEEARARLVGGDVPATKHTQCKPNCTIGGEACNLPPPPDAGNQPDTGIQDAAPE